MPPSTSTPSTTPTPQPSITPANTQSTLAPAPSKEVDPAISSGRAFAPPIGTKIQVLWRIVYEDNKPVADPVTDPKPTLPGTGETGPLSTPPSATAQIALEQQEEKSKTVERWWGAVLQDRTNEKVGSLSSEHADLDVFILLYDSYNDFSEETSRVAFLPNNTLLDLSLLDDSQGGRLDWVEESAMQLEQDTPFVVRPLEWLARETEDITQQTGLPADADLRALATMPHNVQVHVATGYRSFADTVKRLLSELVASKPDGYIITEDDVHTILARVRSQRTNAQPGTVL